MSLPATINSQVDPAAVTRVTRLFNNTLGDILSELIQNARRAGASAVDLKVIDATNAITMPVAIGAADNSLKSISGCGSRSWRRTNTASVTTPSNKALHASSAWLSGLANSLMP